jgi:hypothetical protein
MALYDDTIAKIQQLPEPLVQEVSDFVDFLLMKRDSARWQLWEHFAEAQDITESDFSDYLPALEEYEKLLTDGKVQ